jgi:hypothetical protein
MIKWINLYLPFILNNILNLENPFDAKHMDFCNIKESYQLKK